MTPSISIVSVTYNSRNDVARVVDSLLNTNAQDRYEVVFVDNASADGTPGYLRATLPAATVVERTNDGLSAGINAGVRASHGDYVLLLNPDVRFDSDVAAPLAAYLQSHDDVGIVAPKMLNDDGTLQLSCRAFPSHATALFNRYSLLTRILPRNRFSRRYLMSDFDHTVERDVDWVSGAAMMFSRAAFERVGGWDAGFFLFSEDVDFCKRMHDAGLRVVYYPDVHIEHQIGISKSRRPRIIIERHRSAWRYYRKHKRTNVVVDAITYGGLTARCLFLLADSMVRSLVARVRS